MKPRFITATALLDGQDATLNAVRKSLLKQGAEIIHLGHSRSVSQLVKTALEEDVNALLVTSSQGSCLEFYSHLLDLLKQNSLDKIRLFGIVGNISEAGRVELEKKGMERLYLSSDLEKLTLNELADDLIARAQFSPIATFFAKHTEIAIPKRDDRLTISKYISLLTSPYEELGESSKLPKVRTQLEGLLNACDRKIPMIGFTGGGGSGKSSVIDEVIRRFHRDFPAAYLASVVIDPRKRKSGGSLLGDRIRMNSIYDDHIFMRSMVTPHLNYFYDTLPVMANLFKLAGYDFIFIETPGVGQVESDIIDLVDVCIYITTSDYGSYTQLEKTNILDFADIVALNKFELKRCEDSLAQIRKHFRANRNIERSVRDEDLPIFGTAANRFDDEGVSLLYLHMLHVLEQKFGIRLASKYEGIINKTKAFSTDRIETIIPFDRLNYLGEIVEKIQAYHAKTDEQAKKLDEMQALELSRPLATAESSSFQERMVQLRSQIDADTFALLEWWEHEERKYQQSTYADKNVADQAKMSLQEATPSGLAIPKVALPSHKWISSTWQFLRKENLPGHFPYTAGSQACRPDLAELEYQFAGEGGPQRTNRRIRELSLTGKLNRWNIVFDVATMAGRDPSHRPEIFSLIGERGVSVATIEDMKALFAGVDLSSPDYHIALRSHGPAPVLLAMFFNAVIDQQLEFYRQQNNIPSNQAIAADVADKIVAHTFETLSGTLVSDVLNEDQAQNTGLFTTECALQWMGDVQEYLVEKNARNYHTSVLCGQQMSNAGANPITQLAFVLANGFTLLEYYLKRGMKVDQIAASFRFFLSFGIEPEYAVLGRVGRRIWSIILKERYGAGPESCKFRYYAQPQQQPTCEGKEIRCVLAFLLAMHDNCESDRILCCENANYKPADKIAQHAALVDQIITNELGTARNHNSLQGSYFIEELTRMVEDSVLKLFEELDKRGGVLNAMMSQYQRSKIQDDLQEYENSPQHQKLTMLYNAHNLACPLPGTPRTTAEEKQKRVQDIEEFKSKNQAQAAEALARLEGVVHRHGNIFAELMSTVRYCTLGQIVNLLLEMGSEPRRMG